MRLREDWNHYTYRYNDNKEARVDFDVEAAVLSFVDDTRGLRAIFPSTLTRRVLEEMLANLDVWLVAELHYADKVEFVLQVPASIHDSTLAEFLPSATLQWTPGWDYFNERVCPTPADWRRIQDREALERLDLNHDGLVPVHHRFYGDDAGLDAVFVRLEPEDFDLIERDHTRMTLTHTHPMNDISKITLGLMRLCEQHGVAYDGWVLPG